MKTLALTLALLSAPAAFAGDNKATDAPKTGSTAHGSPASPDAPKTTDAPKPVKLSDSELQVVAHYHAVNLMEVDLGKAALKNSTSAAVKEHGAMIVKDHTASDKKLLALAKKSGQKIPAEKLSTEVEKQDKADQKVKAAQLKKLTGPAFDTQYLTMMVEGHEKELAKIDAKIAEVHNAELADMLKAKKPVLQHHADHARELQKNESQAMR